MKPLLLPAALALGLLAQCHRAAPAPASPVDPLSLLPAETQTGAGTFGCLINGQAFINNNYTGSRGDWQSLSRLSVGSTIYLDGKSDAQAFTVHTVLEGSLASNQNFTLIPATSPNTIFTPGNNQFIADATQSVACSYSGHYIKKVSQLLLTRFDGVARIASGRFAFALYEPGGCDTLRVTDGRFDVKF